MGDEQIPLPDDDKSGQEPVWLPPFNPDGLQAGGTGAALVGLVLAADGATQVSQAGMTADVTHLLTTVLAATGTGVPRMLTLGLALVALGVVLNFFSLALHLKENKEEEKRRGSAPATATH